MKKEIFVTSILLFLILGLSSISASDNIMPKSISSFSENNLLANEGIGIPSLGNSNINIVSPYFNPYNKSRIRFNVITPKKCSLEYSDYIVNDFSIPILQTLGVSNYDYPCTPDENGTGCVEPPPIEFPETIYKPLCKNCYEYNQSRAFDNGIHFLSVRCAENKENKSYTIFSVDGTQPRIIDTQPKDNSFTNGSKFSVKYNDDMVIFAVLHLREVCSDPSKCLTNDFFQFCSLGKKECSFDYTSFDMFNGKEIEYNYTITNIGGSTASSKNFRAFVDTTPPVIKNFDSVINKNTTTFTIEVIDDNFGKVQFIDYHDRNPVWRTLCTQLKNNICKVSKPYPSGTHYFDIRAIDKAGNIGTIQKVGIGNDPIIGDINAPISLIEFGDYQCPFCQLFWNNTMPLIKNNYIDTGLANYVFRDYPLSFHEFAHLSAEASKCVRSKGGDEAFWKMHDKIYSNQDNISKENLNDWAMNLAGESYNISDCLDYGYYYSDVENDIMDGNNAGVTGTPTLFIVKGGKILDKIEGYQDFDSVKQIIDKYISISCGNNGLKCPTPLRK